LYENVPKLKCLGTTATDKDCIKRINQEYITLMKLLPPFVYQFSVSSTSSTNVKWQKLKASLCLTNYALRHEDAWEVNVKNHDFLISALVGGEWLASSTCRFNSGDTAPAPFG
jgi:hypothetical protein